MLAPLLLTVLLVAPGQADVLSRARQAYNAQRFDEAITLAAEARGVERLSHSASLVFARASLERFRGGNDVADIATARQALLSIEPTRLTPSEMAELRLGTGELLFVDEQFGAAAEIFETALGTVDATHRERVLDWWASSLDRHAQLAPEGERQRRYKRLLTGAERELTRTPSSAVAMYWLAAASRGVDDLDRAWSVAVAGWIAGAMTVPGVRGTTLQHDLDRLMRDAIIPERARRAAPPADPEALKVALAAEWASIKQRWTR